VRVRARSLPRSGRLCRQPIRSFQRRKSLALTVCREEPHHRETACFVDGHLEVRHLLFPVFANDAGGRLLGAPSSPSLPSLMWLRLRSAPEPATDLEAHRAHHTTSAAASRNRIGATTMQRDHGFRLTDRSIAKPGLDLRKVASKENSSRSATASLLTSGAWPTRRLTSCNPRLGSARRNRHAHLWQSKGVRHVFET
jgi:hypothetical protein